jgi:ABC-type sugar transport system substrate-binding protein
MKIAVVGARQYPSAARVQSFVRALPADWEIVSGGASGPDTWAQEAAAEQHRTYTVFYADWNRVGRAAGMLRNNEIVNHCDAVVAFVDGPSRGTLDTVKKAVAQRKPVWVIEADDDLPGWEEIVAKVTAFRGPSGS